MRLLVVEQVGQGIGLARCCVQCRQDAKLNARRQAAAFTGLGDHFVGELRIAMADQIIRFQISVTHDRGDGLLPQVEFSWIQCRQGVIEE
jgi:hypothetical protein